MQAASVVVSVIVNVFNKIIHGLVFDNKNDDNCTHYNW